MGVAQYERQEAGLDRCGLCWLVKLVRRPAHPSGLVGTGRSDAEQTDGLTTREAHLIFKLTAFGQEPQALAQKIETFGQEATLEFLVCMKMLAPDKTSKCSGVPESRLFNYWKAEFQGCRAGLASSSPGQEARGDPY